MTAIAWYILSSILKMRCDIFRIRRLLHCWVLRPRCAANARPSGRVLVRHCLEMLVGCGNRDMRALRNLVLPASRAAAIAAAAAAAAALAAIWESWPLVRLAGPVLAAGTTVGARRRACTCTAEVSLAGALDSAVVAGTLEGGCPAVAEGSAG